MDKRFLVSGVAALLLGFAASGQGLQLNEYEVFEENGISVLVYSNQYNGMFCDEKTAGVELIQHGVPISGRSWGGNECCTRNVVQLVTIALAAEEITAALAK